MRSTQPRSKVHPVKAAAKTEPPRDKPELTNPKVRERLAAAARERWAKAKAK